MTDLELYHAYNLGPQTVTTGMTPQEWFAAECVEIARLEGMDTKAMPEKVRIWHQTAISDAYWRRRRALAAIDCKICNPKD